MNADERTCPECAETIKTAAAVCKHCGHRFRSASYSDGPRNETEQKVAKNSKIGCAVVVVGLIAAVAFCTPKNSTTDKGEASEAAASGDGSAYADTSKQFAWIEASKDAIRQRLRDPESAEFRNVHFYSGGPAAVACGEVNSKNGFGGYTGYERFIAAGNVGGLVFLASDLSSPSEMDKAWMETCVKAPTDEA